MYLKSIVSAVLFLFIVSCSNSVAPIGISHNGVGVAKIFIQAPANSQFAQVARKAVISITANDMSASSKELTVSANAVQGVVNNIPSGKNRKFDVEVLDSGSVVKYKGSAIADVPTGETVNVPITLTRTSGNAVINGTIVEDSITTGYQFYRFVINTIGPLGGGTNCVCLTETHFIKGDTAYPRDASDYTVISNGTVYGNGSIAPLFNGSTSANDGYTKPCTENGTPVTPWEWVIDMHQARTFTGFDMACWETFFYQVPTSVTLYGATAADGPWAQIGGQDFSSAYETATVDLFY